MFSEVELKGVVARRRAVCDVNKVVSRDSVISCTLRFDFWRCASYFRCSSRQPLIVGAQHLSTKEQLSACADPTTPETSFECLIAIAYAVSGLGK